MFQSDENGAEKKDGEVKPVKVSTCATCGRVFLHCDCSSNALEK